MAERFVVARSEELSPGTMKRVVVGGRDIALFNVAGEYFALLDRCPHEGASLCAGRIIGLAESNLPGHYQLSHEGEFVRCPWHGWEFEIRTGQSYCGPRFSRLKKFDVQVQSGAELVKGPYKAESLPVTVEDDFVVISI